MQAPQAELRSHASACGTLPRHRRKKNGDELERNTCLSRMITTALFIIRGGLRRLRPTAARNLVAARR
ncbi:MAG: hypothetical protein KatS3mg112_1750 [Thermogutta sp.]|nr:MAG: hypothetical protein KatS3mg112_1750 [Thermogutta sp.]